MKVSLSPYLPYNSRSTLKGEKRVNHPFDLYHVLQLHWKYQTIQILDKQRIFPFPIFMHIRLFFLFIVFFSHSFKFWSFSESSALLCRMLLMGIYASNTQHCQWICREKLPMNWTEPLERYWRNLRKCEIRLFKKW